MDNKIIIETSARHLHVSDRDFKVLFGKDAELTVRKELSQPGQFASEQKVNAIGPKGEIRNITILGPQRAATQLEVSATDARVLGLPACVRESGDIKGSPGCKIVGPCGEIEMSEGVIVAKRHVHAKPNQAEALGVKDREVVMVKVDTENRSLIFGDVVVRVSSEFDLTMHIDTDESNAAGCAGLVYGEIYRP